MLKIIVLSSLIIGAFGFTYCSQPTGKGGKNEKNEFPPEQRIVKSEAEWKKILPPDVYHVMREEATELACSGTLWKNHGDGQYICAACNLPLFDSNTKFESGTGWPSFYQPVNKINIGHTVDTSFGMVRDEVHCARCGGHLGHAFEDGPAPTGIRYCINSVSMKFVPRKDLK